MNYKHTTQVPNELFDIHLPELSFSELKIVLHIIRKTYGWVLKNGKRKQRDRITYNQFHTATKISLRAIPDTIQYLILKHLIRVTDYQGNLLHTPEKRKGKVRIYYAPNFKRYAKHPKKICRNKHKPMQNRAYNKTKGTKLNKQKGSLKRLSDTERYHQILREGREKGFSN